ncbi:MAG TPA: Clp protease N-terminal domain-containing protein [Streptosporangiaceae bacterium]|nr:Clp protease N-terminal domain-containing protein [Streptosporangiaceae bacterium]
MFERFNNRSRLVIVHAQEEARALHHSYIGTEHLLLALVSDHSGMGAIVLESMGATEDRVRERLGHYMPTVEAKDAPSGHIPFTPRAKRVLELGLREALQLGHEFIGTEHLLLALIQEEDGLAGQTLRDLGVRLDAAREQVLARHPPELSPPSPSLGPPGPRPPSPASNPLRAEVESLQAEVARLRDLLRRHDIDPDVTAEGP